MSKTATLVETPADVMDQLALANEVLAKRMEDLDASKSELIRTENQIKSAREQWKAQQDDERIQLALLKQRQEAELVNATAELNAQARAAQDALSRATAHEEQMRHQHMVLNQERAQLRNLTQERIEIAQLKKALALRQTEVEAKWSQAQANLNDANQRLAAAMKTVEEVERRTQELNALDDALKVREKDLSLKAKHLEIVEQALEGKLPEFKEPVLPALPPVQAAPEQTADVDLAVTSPEMLTERHTDFLPPEQLIAEAPAPIPESVPGLTQTPDGMPVIDGTQPIDNKTWKPLPKSGRSVA